MKSDVNACHSSDKKIIKAKGTDKSSHEKGERHISYAIMHC